MLSQAIMSNCDWNVTLIFSCVEVRDLYSQHDGIKLLITWHRIENNSNALPYSDLYKG